MSQKKTIRIIDGKRTVVYASTGCPFGNHIIGQGDTKGQLFGDGHRVKAARTTKS